MMDDEGPQRYRDGDAVFEQVRRGDYLPPSARKRSVSGRIVRFLLRTHHVSEAENVSQTRRCQGTP